MKKEDNAPDYGGQEEDPGHAGPRKRLAGIAWGVMVDPTSVSREVRRNRTALGKVAESRCRIMTCDRFEGCEVRGLYGSWCSSRCRNCPDVRRQATCGSLGGILVPHDGAIPARVQRLQTAQPMSQGALHATGPGTPTKW